MYSEDPKKQIKRKWVNAADVWRHRKRFELWIFNYERKKEGAHCCCYFFCLLWYNKSHTNTSITTTTAHLNLQGNREKSCQ